jgi:hypothetical protein
VTKQQGQRNSFFPASCFWKRWPSHFGAAGLVYGRSSSELCPRPSRALVVQTQKVDVLCECPSLRRDFRKHGGVNNRGDQRWRWNVRHIYPFSCLFSWDLWRKRRLRYSIPPAPFSLSPEDELLLPVCVCNVDNYLCGSPTIKQTHTLPFSREQRGSRGLG